MYENADWDTWDSHRDMILRDRVIFGKMMTFNEINTFGKKGIGNESTYNTGFAFANYIANRFSSESLKIYFKIYHHRLNFLLIMPCIILLVLVAMNYTRNLKLN